MRTARTPAFFVPSLLFLGSALILHNSAAAAGPRINFHPAVLYFKVGTTSSATTTMTNAGTITIFISSMSLTGTHQSDFSLISTCGRSLAPRQICAVTISGFAAKAGLLGTFLEGDSSGPHRVPLEGR